MFHHRRFPNLFYRISTEVPERGWQCRFFEKTEWAGKNPSSIHEPFINHSGWVFFKINMLASPTPPIKEGLTGRGKPSPYFNALVLSKRRLLHPDVSGLAMT
jgi:hypothetical protein